MTNKYIDLVVWSLNSKYRRLGSWAAVSLEIGLTTSDRAAVHKAANGSIVKKVYEALGHSYRQAVAERERLARVRRFGRLPLTGHINYIDNKGRPAKADLGQRAARLGVKRPYMTALDLYLFITRTAVPFLKDRQNEKEKDQKAPEEEGAGEEGGEAKRSD